MDELPRRRISTGAGGQRRRQFWNTREPAKMEDHWQQKKVQSPTPIILWTSNQAKWNDCWRIAGRARLCRVRSKYNSNGKMSSKEAKAKYINPSNRRKMRICWVIWIQYNIRVARRISWKEWATIGMEMPLPLLTKTRISCEVASQGAEEQYYSRRR